MRKRDYWKPEKEHPFCLTEGLQERWAVQAMSEPKKIENPFLFADPDLKKLKDSEFSQVPVSKLFFYDVICATQNDDSVIKNPTENFPNYYTLEGLLKGNKYNTNDQYNESIPKQIVKYASSKAKEQEKIKKPEYFKPFDIKKLQYLALDFNNISIPFTPKEPIVIRTYLFDGKRFVSESVDLFPQKCKSFFTEINELNDSTKVAFEIQQTTPDLIVVLTLSHPLNSNNGQGMVNYYIKRSMQNAQKAVKEISKWSEQKDVLETFGWTCARVTDILTSPNGNFTFPKPVPITEQPDPETIMKYVDEFETKNAMIFEFNVCGKLEIGTSNLSDFILSRAIYYYDDSISYKLRHKLVFNLESLEIEESYENVFASVFLFNNETKTKTLSFRQPFSKKFCSAALSRVVKHKSSKAVFNEVFVLDLPPKVNNSFRIIVELYNADPNSSRKLDILQKIELPLTDKRMFVDSSISNTYKHPGRNLFSLLRKAELELQENFETGVEYLDSIINEKNAEIAWSFASTIGLPIDFEETVTNMTTILPKQQESIWYILICALKTAKPTCSRKKVLQFVDTLRVARRYEHLGRFANCLLSIGMVTACAEIVFRTYQRLSDKEANDFYLSVLTPRHVAETFLLTDDALLTFSLVCQSKDTRIFEKLVTFFSLYSDELGMALIKEMMPGVSFLLPIENSSFFMHFVEVLPQDLFAKWYFHVNHTEAFASLDFVHIRCQKSILSFLEKSLTPHSLPRVTNVMFKLMQNLVTNLFDEFIDFLSDIIKLKEFFMSCTPSIPVFFSKYLDLCTVYPRGFCVFAELYESEKNLYKSVARTRSVLTYMIYLTKPANLKKCEPLKNPPTDGLYQRIKNYLVVKNDLFLSSKILRYSPDCFVEILLKLGDKYHKEELFAEEIQTRVYVVAYIVAHMILCKRISDIFNNEHPFSIPCPASQFIVPSGQKASGIFGEMFTEASIEQMVEAIIKLCEQTKYYEYGVSFINSVEPLCQHVFHRSFSEFKDAMQQNMMTVNERFFGSYFKITSYGKKLGRENGRSRVIRFPKLSRLADVCSYYVKMYTKKYGEGVVEIIKENKRVDDSYKEKESKIYVQIIFVEPYGHKVERIGAFETFHNINLFTYETPFTHSKKAQGSVEEQWIKRTIIGTKDSMPCISRQSDIISLKEIDMPPIRVAYRQLKARVKEIEEAIKNQNMQGLQILLHGNILVQVNEGPARIAEVFLGNPKYADSPYVPKLRIMFNQFLDENREGLELHRKYSIEKPSYETLQSELEAQFDELEDTISAYL